MPVGKIFNAAQDQLLAQPVSAMYQGKKIRQELAMGEKDLELADKKIALQEREIAAREAVVEQNAQKLEADEASQRAIDMANTAIGLSDEYDAIVESDGEEAASANYKAQLEKIREGFEDGSEAAIAIDQILEDNVVQPHEVVRNRSEALAIKGQYLSKKDGSKPSNLTNMYNPETGQRIAVRPDSEFANELAQRGYLMGNPPTSDDDKPDTAKPIPTPTKTESEIVEEFTEQVFEDEKYDKFGFDSEQKTNINRWVADTAERIQRINGQRNKAVGYSDAVAHAAAELDKFISPPGDPGFFSNDSYRFQPPPYNIGDVIEGDDGQQYVVTGYNEQGGPKGEPVGN